MIRRLALLAALCAACKEEGGPVEAPPPVLRIPGTLTGPDGLQADFAGRDSVVVYHWMALEGYGVVDADLEELAALGCGSVPVCPVQFTEEERDDAQEKVNSLGISMPVYLGDTLLESSIPLGALPVAVLFAAGSPPRVETGFGCASRLLSP